MVRICLDPELERALGHLSKKSRRSKNSLIREAIRQFIEDQEDYAAGMVALSRGEPVVSLEELERRLSASP